MPCSSSEVEEYPNILESGPNPEFIAGITKGGGPLKDGHTTTLKLWCAPMVRTYGECQDLNYTWPGLYENSARETQLDQCDKFAAVKSMSSGLWTSLDHC